MKYLLLAIILFSMKEIKSQSLATIGEIYDYNIGDVFIKKFGGFYSPPTFIKSVIINRYYNSSQDTLFYVGNSYTYTPPACSTCSAYFDTILGSIYYITHLDDTVGANIGIKPGDFNCIDTNGYTGFWIDSIYNNPALCNREVIKISRTEGGLMQTDSCFWYFEPLWGYDEYSKGLGYCYHYYNTCSQGLGNCEEKMELIYYIKGTDTCGNAPSILTNMIKNENKQVFTIFPNPSSLQSIVIFSDEQKNIKIDITDIYGNEQKNIIFNGQQLVINTRELKKGIYYVRVNDNKKTYCKKLIVQ